MPKVDVGVAATGLTRSRSMTISDGDVTRTTAALKRFYGQVEVTAADGTVTRRDRTDQEAWDRFFEGVRLSLVGIVEHVERDQGIAAVSVTQVNVS